jgi:hypothetical protein
MKSRSAVVGAVVTAVALAAGVAYATIPDGQGVIHACYKTDNGQLRIVDDADCNPSETSLSWSQVGPEGLAGAKGDAGPKGDPGADGAQGPSGLASVIHVSHVFQTSFQITGGDVPCPSGTTVLGGGASGNPDMDLVESGPDDPDFPHAWHVIARNTTASGTWSFTGYVLCGSS